MQETKAPSCGQWRTGSEIGHGAYGVVYLATGPDGTMAAVKVCRRSDVGDERYDRELRGAKLYSSIPPQEGLVHMREFAEEPWGFYAVMDLADDEFGRELSGNASYRPKTLASLIDGEKALPLGECVKLGIALAKGLAALQRHHLLHRDIKPANVLYFKGRPVLSDPGLVVAEGDAVSTVGTPIYVPPEGRFTEPASDIYSLGLTLKAASFGRSIEDLDKGPALEADTGAKLFPAWWRILNKATDPTSSRRYQSAKALLKDLESLRRKMAVASIVGSRAARFAIAALALAVIAIIVPIVITSRRAKNDLIRQSAETKSLREGLARQSAENKLLKADLAKQSDEIQSLKSDLVKQPEESKALKDALDRQSEENKSLRADLARQSEENKSLKDDLARQAEEIKSLKDDLVRQPFGKKAEDVDAAQQSLELERLRKEVEQLRKVSDEKARVAAQDAWEAVLRNAYRETFDGISEEKLSSMVKEARKEIFGDKK